MSDSTPVDDATFHVPASGRRRMWWLLLTAIILSLGIAAAYSFIVWRGSPKLIMHAVDRGDIVVSHRFTATVVSANESDIFCDVSAHSSLDGRHTTGAELLWIVPNLSIVTQGDLLAEFDATIRGFDAEFGQLLSKVLGGGGPVGVFCRGSQFVFHHLTLIRDPNAVIVLGEAQVFQH